jgi:hypothetical protein
VRRLQSVRKLDVPTLRAIWWTARSVRALRRRLPDAGLDARVAPAPPVPAHAVRGVEAVLSRVASASCLERALILQAWFAGHGCRHPVMVGVALDTGFEAHAWLDGYDAADPRFSVLTRVA